MIMFALLKHLTKNSLQMFLCSDKNNCKFQQQAAKLQVVKKVLQNIKVKVKVTLKQMV